MMDSSMTTTALLIRCPVCGASGGMIHHDIRSSLIYSCLNCTHEWQIDPVGLATTESPVSDDPGTSSQAERPRPHKSDFARKR